MKTVKTFTLALFLVLVFTWALPAAAVSVVSVPATASVSPGGDVVVPITVNPADGVISMDFAVQYDSGVLTPTGVFRTAYTNGFSLEWNVPTPGDLRVSLFSVDPLAGSGEVVWIRFHAAAS